MYFVFFIYSLTKTWMHVFDVNKDDLPTRMHVFDLNKDALPCLSKWKETATKIILFVSEFNPCCNENLGQFVIILFVV